MSVVVVTLWWTMVILLTGKNGGCRFWLHNNSDREQLHGVYSVPGALQINGSANPQMLRDHLDFRGKGRRLKLFKDLPKKTELTTENQELKGRACSCQTPSVVGTMPSQRNAD